MHDTDRATGKTTRTLLATALAMSQGKRVLVVTYHHASSTSMVEHLLQVLTALCPGFVERTQRGCVRLKNGGEVRFVSRDNLERGLCGLSFDEFHSDVGQLSTEELMNVAPVIRSQSVVDIDITHFETEYDLEELELAPLEGAEDEETQPAIEPKERTRAHRVLSSR